MTHRALVTMRISLASRLARARFSPLACCLILLLAALPLPGLAQAANEAPAPEARPPAVARFSVAGTPLNAAVIVAAEANQAAAETWQHLFHEATGIRLTIAAQPGNGPAIELSSRAPERPGYFDMTVTQGRLVLRTDREHGFQRGITCFFANVVRDAGKTLDLPEGFHYSKEFSEAVRYSEFGARGDGHSDDIDAIAEAHAFANQHGLTVRADNEATYYISGKNRTAIIQTDTDFAGAAFIIDDTAVENRRAHVFAVRSNLKAFPLEGVTSLRKNQERLDVTLPGPCIITATDANVKRYIRYGANQNNGSAQTDVFIVDANGHVDMNAPIIWDFSTITSLSAHPMDTDTLTISGGRFTTRANAAESKYTYYSRGIAINRSNVRVDGLEHRITGEGDHGAPYGGFLSISRCANVTVSNTVLSGHKTYRTIGSAGRPVSMGTYDISLNRALNVSFVNCSQTNDIKNGTYWGIMGSNYCKNLLLDNCSFSRFDAHMGVANATIRNSTLGHAGINAIGSGIFVVENSTIYGRTLINLRSDYGSTWQGEFHIRNCVFVPAAGRTTSASLIGGSYSGKHDFGYTCHMPERIIIEGLHIDDANHPQDYQGPAIFANFNRAFTDSAYVETYPYVKTREVMLKDVTTTSGKPLRLSDNPVMFKDVRVITQDAP